LGEKEVNMTKFKKESDLFYSDQRNIKLARLAVKNNRKGVQRAWDYYVENNGNPLLDPVEVTLDGVKVEGVLVYKGRFKDSFMKAFVLADLYHAVLEGVIGDILQEQKCKSPYGKEVFMPIGKDYKWVSVGVSFDTIADAEATLAALLLPNKVVDVNEEYGYRRWLWVPPLAWTAKDLIEFFKGFAHSCLSGPWCWPGHAYQTTFFPLYHMKWEAHAHEKPDSYLKRNGKTVVSFPDAEW
jgi:hypothetical protein